MTFRKKMKLKPLIFRRASYALQGLPSCAVLLVQEHTGERAGHCFHWEDVESIDVVPTNIELPGSSLDS